MAKKKTKKKIIFNYKIDDLKYQMTGLSDHLSIDFDQMKQFVGKKIVLELKNKSCIKGKLKLVGGYMVFIEVNGKIENLLKDQIKSFSGN